MQADQDIAISTDGTSLLEEDGKENMDVLQVGTLSYMSLEAFMVNETDADVLLLSNELKHKLCDISLICKCWSWSRCKVVDIVAYASFPVTAYAEEQILSAVRVVAAVVIFSGLITGVLVCHCFQVSNEYIFFSSSYRSCKEIDDSDRWERRKGLAITGSMSYPDRTGQPVECVVMVIKLAMLSTSKEELVEKLLSVDCDLPQYMDVPKWKDGSDHYGSESVQVRC
ncbi:alcohol dehydrogenase superfamily, zinc-type [Artemisia annua]|uniref:Alcohol dehydrogenase superfamily, zinc-type n=1 Tax=Artemisia annua TaxID=35608 RepID=A0A2U1KE13_ARTAN|nr:alcohol dehydrogenase superfamily, zinc-type [Artemisia annua]